MVPHVRRRVYLDPQRGDWSTRVGQSERRELAVGGEETGCEPKVPVAGVGLSDDQAADDVDEDRDARDGADTTGPAAVGKRGLASRYAVAAVITPYYGAPSWLRCK